MIRIKRAAIITGASSGIGREIAIRLAEAGYSVCINYNRNQEGANALVRKLNESGYRALAYGSDVSDQQSVNNMVDAVRKKLGEVDILVNNAGISHHGLFQDTDDETWKRIIDVNLNGTRNAIMAVLPQMLSEKKGSIVNISSIWGLRAASCEVAYACSKAAIIGLTRSLAAELAPSGIRVNCIAPGCIATDMTLALGSETLGILKEETPMGRLGTARDVANAVAFMASEEAGFITGQVLTVDGGFIG